MPFCFLLIWYSWDYVAVSWQISESSQEASGLPFPFPALMKSFIPAAASLLLLQGVVIVSRSVTQLKNIPAEQ
jgi:TRAP-type mannitol/chloroaromatic compound transport system permease small subunit